MKMSAKLIIQHQVIGRK